MPLIETEDHGGVRELSDLLHVNRTTISNWSSRQDDFPEQVVKYSNCPVWNLLEVAYWWTHWEPKRVIPKVGYLDQYWQDRVAALPKPEPKKVEANGQTSRR